MSCIRELLDIGQHQILGDGEQLEEKFVQPVDEQQCLLWQPGMVQI